MPRTLSEVEELKRLWKDDPCWDLHKTEGFEDHVEELKAFQEQCEKVWREKVAQEQKERDEAAIKLGVRDLYHTREVDVKVAAKFGWQYGSSHQELPHFSSTGDGMLLLIEKARKQDIDLWFKHTSLGAFKGVSGIVSEGRGYEETFETSEMSSLPLAVSLAFLLAHGVDIKQLRILSKESTDVWV
ncbi:hypothetical protein ACFYU8_18535 [Brevibacillus sp. NPDC003359]|uniref:hypothetical protein n=1 Tax=unclassified Brevibacillus TaxID=2684853 RepID=UPI0036AF260C